ncbi:hypothetical protein KY366_03205 [Candidatus Woesearchaeota archaeon]|nr:hypothetical protein [Candidatus Woesearchaeota archaeon]
MNKAKKEMEKEGKHRGLIKSKPDKKKAGEHIVKAEHYLKATLCLQQNEFSDLCASSLFYVIYQSLLAIAAKFGYESRNQTCTFALIETLIENKQIDLSIDTLKKIVDTQEKDGSSCINIREEYQYGTGLSLETSVYNNLLDLAKEVMEKAKTIIEID